MTLCWPFMPQMNVVESLEWLTDIIKCKRAEYRFGLRPMPRITYQCKYILDDVDYGVARELARTVGGDPVFVPDWPNATQVPTVGASTVSFPVDSSHAPAYRVSGSALVYGTNASYEVVTVSSLGTGTISTSATVAGYTTPWIVPLRLGTFSQNFTGDRGPHDYIQASAAFLCVDTEVLTLVGGGIAYPDYLGNPVITSPIEIINGATENNVREVEELDSHTGPIYKYPLYATPNQGAVMGWYAGNAADLWALRVWLHTIRGRWKQFWTSSWANDAVLTSDVNVGDSHIQIAAIGFASRYPIPCDIGVVGGNGSSIYIRVASVTVVGGNEQLGFTGAVMLGGTVIPMSSSMVSKLTLSRIDSDRIEIQHLPGRQAEVKVPTKEVPIYP